MALPFVHDFLLRLARESELGPALPALEHGERVDFNGLTGAAQLLFATFLQRLSRRPVILIVPDNRIAEEWRETLATFQDLTRGGEEQRPLVLPAFDIDPYEGLSPHADILEQRALALWRATQGLPLLIVPAVAAAARLAQPGSYKAMARTIRRGDFVDLDGLAEHLVLVGYTRNEPVEQPGQFSIRGGLLDVFSPEAAHPVRIELFGDEVESLREFDLATQRSLRTIEHTLLLPLTSLPPLPERVQRVLDHLQAQANDEVPAGDLLPPGWEFLVAEIEQFDHSIFDLQPRALVVVSEPEAVQAELRRWWKRLGERAAAAREAHGIRMADGALVPCPPTPEKVFFTEDEFLQRLESRAGLNLRELNIESVDLAAETLDLRLHPRDLRTMLRTAETGEEEIPTPEQAEAALRGGLPSHRRVSVASRPAPRYQGAVAHMMEELRRQLDRQQRLVFVAGNAGEVERLGDLFTEYNIPFQLGITRAEGDYLAEKAFWGGDSPRSIVVPGDLFRGFSLPRQQVTFYGYSDLFHDEGPYRPLPPTSRRSNLSTFMSDFRDLAIGDYVVHVEHGVGQYVGLKSMDGEVLPARSGPRALEPSGDGVHPQQDNREFMVIEYADHAKLYVPLTRMDLVQKYRSAEGGARPHLDRLGGTQWQARKSKVRKAMRDMADELLKLYAVRQSVHIPPCGPDGPWQREFEDAFPYTETVDQERAIDDIHRDLLKPQPMDRLLVGDVGYGKTEVAMRAAFKIVSEGRQVAVLTPTTVLSFQHFETFKHRFRSFPITIEMISRFRTPAQQKEIVRQLGEGKIDIVIGTHRLLSKDVKIQNLGLLVVDEEQRFGVRDKERLKQLKREVHVLSMSATPIPRTLHMSLVGMRDMSVIETPPKDRLAIQTVVAPFDEHVIASAIDTELNRGGQVYFVHNRVETIWEIAAVLQRLAPQARIAVGHGQMQEHELEKVMLRFIQHEADILVSTTIIENGLDIPLANTMVVNRADRLGLSELYQLRGRVGRSNRRAYAYLLVPNEAELTPIARKRLAAMREFSDLGAGFKIAALDLELRGAGNLLGGEQSGNIDAIGFDLYVQMLEQAVRELKGEEVAPELDVQLQLGLDLRIPAEYIPEENQRLRMYKRLAEAEEERQREDVLKEMQDRYGQPPAPVQNLVAYAALKALCRRAGIQSLEKKKAQLQLRFTGQSNVDPMRLAELVESTRGAQFTPQGVLKLPFVANGAAAVLQGVHQILDTLLPEEAVATRG